MGKEWGVTRAETDTSEDVGASTFRERKPQPNHRCPVQRLKLASERKQEIDTRLQTRQTTQRGKDTGREKSYYSHNARWREGLQPDLSRRG